MTAATAMPADGRREGVLSAGVRRLHPAYFALVMATGIVSVAAKLLGMEPVAQALFVVNLVAFPVLWVLTITRAVVHPSDFFADLVDHQRGVGFFTVVAGDQRARRPARRGARRLRRGLRAVGAGDRALGCC